MKMKRKRIEEFLSEASLRISARETKESGMPFIFRPSWLFLIVSLHEIAGQMLSYVQHRRKGEASINKQIVCGYPQTLLIKIVLNQT